MVRDELPPDHDADTPAPTIDADRQVGPASSAGDVTRILAQIEQGEPQAAEQLLPLVYEELRELAAAKMAQEKAGQTLDATALVHEAYVRLAAADMSPHWNSRGHFYCAAAEAMRRILVENARRKSREKHGGGRHRCDLDGLELASPTGICSHSDLLALDEALTQLAAREPLKGKLVQLRFFGGLSNDQAAQALGISAPTAKRYWRYARAWLHAILRPEGEAT